MRTLTGAESGALRDALLDAYRGRHDVEQLLYFRLNRRLNDYVGDTGLREVIGAVVMRAGSEGWLPELVDACLADRPHSHALQRWATDRRWVSADAAALVPPPDLQLLNSVFFDLDALRKRVTRAKYAAGGSRLLGLGVGYSEPVFVNKLCDWLPYCLGDLERKDLLTLRPEWSSVDKRIKHVAPYLAEVASTNVVCPVLVDGVPMEYVGAFWDGVRARCVEPDNWLVLIFFGEGDGAFPDGVTELDPPRFELDDLRVWTHEMVARLKWPMPLAEAWCDAIVARSGGPDSLDVRLVYGAMDSSIRAARQNPIEFRSTLERSG